MARKSKSDEVMRLLRAAILNGTFPPGARLGFAMLRERYSCSTGVVQQALTQLVGEGLVTSEPRVGYRVINVSAEDLRQLTEARILLETLVLRMAMVNRDTSWEARLVASHHTLTTTPTLTADRTVSEAWTDAHRRFHGALLDCCPNVRLVRMASSLRDAAGVYQCWSYNSVKDIDAASARDGAAEHRAILEAVLGNDQRLAGELLAQHIGLTTEILLSGSRVASGVNT